MSDEVKEKCWITKDSRPDVSVDTGLDLVQAGITHPWFSKCYGTDKSRVFVFTDKDGNAIGAVAVSGMTTVGTILIPVGSGAVMTTTEE